jgi:hypothetical protein
LENCQFWLFKYFWFFEKNQNSRTTSSSSLKKTQNQGTSSSGYFKNLKAPTVFMKEPVKNHWFSVQFFHFFIFFENCGHTPNPVL